MENQTLKEKIQEDMKAAMRAKETLRLGTIRMLMAAIKQREIDERVTLDDSGVINVINKMIKQRRESAEQYKTANRMELADKENAEIKILESYLPQQLSEEEIEKAVQDALKTTDAKTMQDMGKVMGILKEKLAGRADMAKVSAKVRQHLQ